MPIRNQALTSLHHVKQAVEEVVKDQSCYQGGTLYHDVLCREVTARLGEKAAIPDLFRGTIDVSSFTERQQAEAHLEGQPRGAWAIVRQDLLDRVSYGFRMSDGLGELAGRYDSYDEPPTFEQAREKLLNGEVYRCRAKVEQEIALQERKDCLERLNLRVDQTFKNLEMFTGRGRESFSTLVITAIEENHTLNAEAKKRGSRNRFILSGISPQAIERALPKSEPSQNDEEPGFSPR